jgi:hypothetical protein
MRRSERTLPWRRRRKKKTLRRIHGALPSLPYLLVKHKVAFGRPLQHERVAAPEKEGGVGTRARVCM